MTIFRIWSWVDKQVIAIVGRGKVEWGSARFAVVDISE